MRTAEFPTVSIRQGTGAFILVFGLEPFKQDLQAEWIVAVQGVIVEDLPGRDIHFSDAPMNSQVYWNENLLSCKNVNFPGPSTHCRVS